MLDPDNLIGGCALRRQVFLEPAKSRHDHRVLIAQPLDELHGEGRGQRGTLEPTQNGRSGLN